MGKRVFEEVDDNTYQGCYQDGSPSIMTFIGGSPPAKINVSIVNGDFSQPVMAHNTFQYIKRCKNNNGFVDCNKLFRKISVGDTIIFSCKNNKIEAQLKKVNIYKSLQEMLDSTSVKTIEYNGVNPFEFLEIINNKSKKKFRVYDVDYYEDKTYLSHRSNT